MRRCFYPLLAAGFALAATPSFAQMSLSDPQRDAAKKNYAGLQKIEKDIVAAMSAHDVDTVRKISGALDNGTGIFLRIGGKDMSGPVALVLSNCEFALGHTAMIALLVEGLLTKQPEATVGNLKKQAIELRGFSTICKIGLGEDAADPLTFESVEAFLQGLK